MTICLNKQSKLSNHKCGNRHFMAVFYYLADYQADKVSKLAAIQIIHKKIINSLRI